jgi:hypothetical protein
MSADDPFMVIADQFTKIIEVSAGHREKAITAGFSPATAEAMALELHGVLMEILTSKSRKR